MDSYDLPLAETGPGLCGCDREVFERVWRRVMPTDTYGSPVQLIGEEPAGALRCESPQIPLWPETPQPRPEAPPPPQQQYAPVCLGPTSAVHGAQLQALIVDELSDSSRYLALARRSKGAAAKTLSAMSADEKRHAKRLSTAYFLISGVHYWPESSARPAPTGPMPACLRQAFLNEQKGEMTYREAAARTADLCLRELFLDLAADENSHAWLLRGLLESM